MLFKRGTMTILFMRVRAMTPFKPVLATTTSTVTMETMALFAGPNDDYENGGSGNDELYAQDGDDVLEGGPGADFFDCGPGFDTVVDFNPNEGDITNDNCEDVRNQL